MDKVLQCDCGFVAHAADEEGLVEEVQRHAWEQHRMTLSHHEALLLVFRAELDATCTDPDPSREDTSNEGGEMKSKWLWALLVVVLGVAVYAGNVLATPSSGLTTTILAKSLFDNMNIKPTPLTPKVISGRP